MARTTSSSCFSRVVGFSLALVVMFATPALADTVTLAWDANTEADLAGYRVYYGTGPGIYSSTLDVGNVTSVQVPSLQPGRRYFFAVVAYNTSELSSAYSDEVSALIPAPPPTVAAVSPAIGPVAGGTAFTVTGTNFRAGAIVTIGGVIAQNVAVVSPTTITGVTGAAPAAGLYEVRVTNSDATSAALVGAFTYTTTAVTVTAVQPASGLTTGGTAVTISGSNFVAGATVLVGGIAATGVSVLNQTTIVAVTPARAAGTVDVRVTNPGGAFGTLAGGFTYVSGAPTIATVTPAQGSWFGGTVVTIAGTNFAGGMTVSVGGVAATNVAVVNATTLTAQTPAHPGTPQAVPETVAVSVTSPNGLSATKPSAFTYEVLTPAIAAVSPVSGGIEGGTRLTLTGSDFLAGAVVRLAGVAATEVVVVDESTITAVTPAHAAGPVDVSVVNPGGTHGDRPGAFTYVGDDPTVDTDGDGLPDLWEHTFGLDPNSAEGDDGAAGDPDGDGATNLQEFETGTHPRGFETRYFAEGVNSYFFITTLALANPGDRPASAIVHYVRSNGPAVRRTLTLAPRSRATLDSRDVEGLEDEAFATTIESDELLVVDRTVSWDKDQEFGAHAETAIERPSDVWYLAEGATQAGFDLFYLIQNPNPQTERVEVTYLLPDGAPIVKTYDVPAKSRFTIWVDIESPALAWTDVSAVIRCLSGRPIIVERAMYLNAGGLTWGAGHASAGVTAPATKWFFAEGATGQYFDTFILIANPGPQNAQVRATFLLPSGETFSKDYVVGKNSRFNIWVDLEDPRLADTAVSTTIESLNGVEIIAERSMWWPGPTFLQWSEAHNSPGTTFTGTKWALAEGEEGGARDRTTYILVANTSPTRGDVKVTLLYEDATTETRTFGLQGNSRFNVWVRGEFPNSLGRRFGAIVESVGTTPAQLVVERAMYWNALGQVWAAGTNAVATILSEPQ